MRYSKTQQHELDEKSGAAIDAAARIARKAAGILSEIEATEHRIAANPDDAYLHAELCVLRANLAKLNAGHGLLGHFKAQAA